MPGAPWEIPDEALTNARVQEGVKLVRGRRPKTLQQYREDLTIRLPFD
jgi:hypothetical protein